MGGHHLHNNNGPEARYAVEREADPTTKWDEEVARGLELGLPGADSLVDRRIPTFSRGERFCCVAGSMYVRSPRSGLGSDRPGEFGKRSRDPLGGRSVDTQLVVAAASVLHEGLPCDDHLCCVVRSQSAHRSQTVFELAVVSSIGLLAYCST